MSVEDQNINSINQYLIDIEQTFSDIVIGTERSIRWFDDRQQQTHLSIVYIHGFSASRQEISPVTEQLADRLKANVFYTRLKGHGRSDQAMATASIEDWQNDIKQALQIGNLIGKKVILISTSTGGTLATWLLSAYAGHFNVVANIMMSPNFGVKQRSAEIIRWPLGLTIAKLINGSDYHSFEPLNETQETYWTERYPMQALVPMIRLVAEVRKMEKANINVPQLWIYSPQDQVVDVQQLEKAAKQFTGSKLNLVEFTDSSDPAQHVLAGDAVSPKSTEAVVTLMYDYLESLNLYDNEKATKLN